MNAALDHFDLTFDRPVDPATFAADDVQVVVATPQLVGWCAVPGNLFDVRIDGTRAYVVEQTGGLRIIDISTPASPAQIGYYDTPGIAGGVDVVGSLAYVADGNSGLRILDVSNPAAPALVGFYDTPGYANGVKVVGTLAYVADGSSGVQIIDISTPAAPVRVGFVDTPGDARDLDIAGGRAYVADDHSDLRIIDVSNPAAPVSVGSFSMPGYAYGVQVVGNLAYIAAVDAGLQIIDVSNPASPKAVGSCAITGISNGVYVVGTQAYVANGTTGLASVDVSNPASPQLLSYFDTPNSARAVQVVDSLAYVAGGGRLTVVRVGLPAQSVSQLDATTYRVQFPAPLTDATYRVAVGPALADAGGHIMDQDGDGIGGEFPDDRYVFDFTIDTTPPPAPASLAFADDTGVVGDGLTSDGQLVFTWTAPADATGILRYDCRLDGGEWSQTVSPSATVSVTDGPHLFEVRAVDKVGNVGAVAVRAVTVDRVSPTAPAGLRLLGAVLSWTPSTDANGIWKYQCSVDSGAWTAATGASFATGLAEGTTHDFAVRAIDKAGNTGSQAAARLTVDRGPRIVAHGTGAAVGAGVDHLDLTFSEPIEAASFTSDDILVARTTPVAVGLYNTLGNAHAVAVVGSLAYEADAGAGLYILDVSDPAAPAGVGHLYLPGLAFDVQVVGTLAYVANYGSGLQVIDVSNPAAPVKLGSIDSPRYANAVQVVGSLAYVASNGLRIIDVSNPANPVEIGSVDASFTLSDVQVVGTLAYATAYGSGLRIIDVSNPVVPVEVGYYDTPGSAYGVHVVGTVACVADDTSGLRVIDVSNPTSPVQLGFYDTPGLARRVQLVGTVAFVAEEGNYPGQYGLRIIDISSPASPTMVGSFATAASALDVQVSGTLAYVAEDVSGLRILRVGQEVREISQIDATTWRLGFDGALPDATFRVSVRPQITDLAGNPMDQNGDGVGGASPADGLSFALAGEAGPKGYPLPLTAIGPAEWTAWENSATGVVDLAGDVDDFTVDLAAGQAATVVVTGAGNLKATVDLLRPDMAPVASGAATAAAQPVFLQSAVLPVSGTYTLRIGGAGTTGSYTVRLLLNATVETEPYTLAANGTQFTAQGLDAALLALDSGAIDPAPRRAAVVGKAAGSDADWYSFGLDAGQTISMAGASSSGLPLNVELYRNPTPPTAWTLATGLVLSGPPGGCGGSIVQGPTASMLLLKSRRMVKSVAADGTVRYATVVSASSQSAVLDQLLPAGATSLWISTQTVASAELVCRSVDEPGGLSGIHQYIAAQGGMYWVRVTADPSDTGGSYSLLVARDADVDVNPSNGLTGAGDITAVGSVLGFVDAGGMGRLFAYDGNANRILELDPQTGAEINSFPAPVTGPGFASAGLATTGTSLLFSGGGDVGAIYELDPDSGQVLRTLDVDLGDLSQAAGLPADPLEGQAQEFVTGLAYQDGRIFLALGGVPNPGPLANVYIEVYSGTVGDPSHLLWSVPMDERYDSPWIWRLSQEQFDEFLASPGHGYTYDYQGYVPGADPSTYWFVFEDTRGIGSADFYDLMLKVEYSVETVRLTPKMGTGACQYRLVSGGQVLIPDVRLADGVSVELPNWGADPQTGLSDPNVQTGAVIALDYQTGGRLGAWSLQHAPGGLAGRGPDVLELDGNAVSALTGEHDLESLGDVAGLAEAAGAGVVAHELFVAADGRIEVYDATTLQHLRTLAPPPNVSLSALGGDEDDPGNYYHLAARAGDELAITAEAIPLSGAPGSFEPVFDLYGPDGLLLASRCGSAMHWTAATDGQYTVRVHAHPGEAGAYLLHVQGQTGAVPSAFGVRAAHLQPGNPGQAGSTLVIDFAASLRADTLAVGDILINGAPAAAGSMTVVDGDTITLLLPSGGAPLWNVSINDGTVLDLNGRPVLPFTATLSTDTTAPPAPGGLAVTEDTGSPGDGITAAGNLTVSWAAVTDLTGIARYEYQLDGGAWAAATECSAGLTLREGPHTVSVRAVDGAGNSGPASAVAVVVDQTAPQAPEVWLEGAVLAWAEPLDSGGIWKYELSLDGGDWTEVHSTRAPTDWPPASTHSAAVRAVDRAGNASAGPAATFLVPAAVVGRHLFYNGSALDGGDSGTGDADDAAIDTGKSPLLAGPAGPDCVSGFSRGINGIMIDIAGPGGAATAEDFQFDMNSGDGVDWRALPVGPLEVAIRPGKGNGGSTRVTVTLPDDAVGNGWLRVTVLATDRTGLAGPDVSYWGHLAGNVAGDAAVNVYDLLGVTKSARLPGGDPGIDPAADVNRDGAVDDMDLAVVRGNYLAALSPLNAPASPPVRTRPVTVLAGGIPAAHPPDALGSEGAIAPAQSPAPAAPLVPMPMPLSPSAGTWPQGSPVGMTCGLALPLGLPTGRTGGQMLEPPACLAAIPRQRRDGLGIPWDTLSPRIMMAMALPAPAARPAIPGLVLLWADGPHTRRT